MFCKGSVLKNFINSSENPCAQILFFDKGAAPKTEKSDFRSSPQKTNLDGRLAKKGRGLGQFAKRGLARKRGWCFEEGGG